MCIFVGGTVTVTKQQQCYQFLVCAAVNSAVPMLAQPERY